MVPRWLGTQRGLGVGTDPLNWPPETSPLGASSVEGWGVGVLPASKELGSDKPALLGGEPQWETLGLGVTVGGTGTPGTPWV